MEDKAFLYFNMINPIEHSNTKEKSDKYKIEPYIIPADIYGSQNLLGRGGWSWYTGSAAWYYVAGIEYILGLKINDNILTINPCIPNEWKQYSIQYRYGESIYNIKISNLKQTNKIQEVIVNNVKNVEKYIKLLDNKKINDIEIII